MRAREQDLRETHLIGSETRQQVVWAAQVPALKRRRISVAGVSDAAHGFAWTRLRPDLAQVLAVVDGQGEVRVGDAWTLATAGSAYLTAPGATHAYRATRMGRWLVAWVIWSGGDVRASPVAGPEPALVAADPRALHLALQGLYLESIGGRDAAALEAWAALVDGAARRIAGESGGRRLWRLWAEVDADLAHRWTIRELAAHAGMSDEHLRRTCLRECGDAPIAHLARLRMERAAMLLATTTRAVEDVAAAVGYDSPFAFTHAFKRHHGEAPARWRAKRR